MNDLLVLTRAIHYGAVLWLFGEFVLFGAVVAPACRRVSADVPGDLGSEQRRLIRVASWGVAIGIASSIAWLLLEAANMSGAPLAAAISGDTLGVVVRETLFGRIWAIRLALSLLLAAMLWFASGNPSPRRGTVLTIGGTLLGGAYAATLAGTGHAAIGAMADRYVHLGCDAVHLLAAGAWVGALPGLVSLLKRAGDRERPQAFALAAEATRRFSSLSLISVSALVFTGLVNASYLVGSVQALIETDYGILLMWKLLLFALMSALAATNRLRLSPEIAGVAPSTTDDSKRAALARLRQNAMVELATGAAIVGIVAALGLSTPAVHMQGPGSAHSMPSDGHLR